jgi:hypothetical protein
MGRDGRPATENYHRVHTPLLILLNVNLVDVAVIRYHTGRFGNFHLMKIANDDRGFEQDALLPSDRSRAPVVLRPPGGHNIRCSTAPQLHCPNLVSCAVTSNSPCSHTPVRLTQLHCRRRSGVWMPMAEPNPCCGARALCASGNCGRNPSQTTNACSLPAAPTRGSPAEALRGRACRGSLRSIL